LEFKDFQYCEILKSFVRIKNKSTGLNGIPFRLINNFLFDFVFALTNCINRDFNNCCLKELKISCIKPLFKKGNKSNLGNSKPISNVSNIIIL